MAKQNNIPGEDLIASPKLTKAQRAQLKEYAEIALCRKSYSAYVEYAHRPDSGEASTWKHSRHLDYICEQVQEHVETVTGHALDILIVQVPPQHGKSMTITETLPSWYLGRFPDRRIILASYNDETAERFTRRNKEKIRAVGGKVFGIQIGPIDRATEVELARTKGRMLSRGIMGGITSNAADLVVIDDPVKNRQEADSETYRERQWDEWLNTIKTRLSAGAKVIVIMTRWHEDDLAGRIIANEKYVTVLNLPCEAEEGDPLGRKPGESLFPEIGKDDSWLSDFKYGYMTAEGSRAWNALFQGRPVADEGNMIKREWWQRYKTIPDRFDEMIQSWDCAFKAGDNNDFVVGGVWGRVGGRYYLLDVVKAHMDIVETMRAVEAMTKKWPGALLKLIEDKANGSAVIQMLRAKIPGIVAVEPDGGKVARVSAVLPAIEAKNVFVPEVGATSWVNDFVDECAAFPNGKHDDQVDMMSQALNRLIYQTGSRYVAPGKWPVNSLQERVERQLEKLTSRKKRSVIDW